MTALIIILSIFLTLLLLCIWKARRDARREGKRLGFWASLKNGTLYLFGWIIEGVLSLVP